MRTIRLSYMRDWPDSGNVFSDTDQVVEADGSLTTSTLLKATFHLERRDDGTPVADFTMDSGNVTWDDLQKVWLLEIFNSDLETIATDEPIDCLFQWALYMSDGRMRIVDRGRAIVEIGL